MPNSPGSDANPNLPGGGSGGWFQRTKAWWYRTVRKTLFQWILFIIGLVLFGAFSVVAVDATDYVFSTQKFCANTCHVMESTVYQEYKKSKHYNTATGVRPHCADCHVSRRLTYAMIDHFMSTGELFVWLTHDFSKPGSFEKFRPEAANTARFKLLDSNSANCKSCHTMAAIKPERVRGQNAHREAMKNGNSNCIACHYNLVHKKVEPSQEFLNAAKKYIGSAGGEESKETKGISGEGATL
ncbi:MAG: NapC/NirT family cytochrome c [Gammaproteobacteria bacterium]|jgi:nitrate/TMAO reductase-like tetraheme cytochrome c subunit